MLAALAQPNNNTELRVLQRLFSLADVNSKATQVFEIINQISDSLISNNNLNSLNSMDKRR